MISESDFTAGRRWLWPLLASLVILALAIGGEAVSQLLRYDRAAISTGQWYRLLSGHWLHLNGWHAFMNAAALWLLAAIDTQPTNVGRYALRTLWLSIAVGLGLFLFQINLAWYVGLSGVLHGLFMIVLVRIAWQRRDVYTFSMLVILLGKLVWEHYHGPLTQDSFDVPVIVAAHSYGAIAGLVYVAIGVVLNLRRGK